MPQITSIVLNLETGSLPGSSTDGDVYLSVCGRKFCVDTEADDFHGGSSRRYIFGEGANVRNASVNDPRQQRLLTENVDLFPVYLRFQPQRRDDNWQFLRATMFLNDPAGGLWDTASFVFFDHSKGLWLGTRSGLVVHLRKLTFGVTEASPVAG